MKRQCYIAIFLVILFAVAVYAGTHYGTLTLSTNAVPMEGFIDLSQWGLSNVAHTFDDVTDIKVTGDPITYYVPAEYDITISVSAPSNGDAYRKVKIVAGGRIKDSSGCTHGTFKETYIDKIGTPESEQLGTVHNTTTSYDFLWSWTTSSAGNYTLETYGSGGAKEGGSSVGGSWTLPLAAGGFSYTRPNIADDATYNEPSSTQTISVGREERVFTGSN